jgi:hypothetical protein
MKSKPLIFDIIRDYFGDVTQVINRIKLDIYNFLTKMSIDNLDGSGSISSF